MVPALAVILGLALDVGVVVYVWMMVNFWVQLLAGSMFVWAESSAVRAAGVAAQADDATEFAPWAMEVPISDWGVGAGVVGPDAWWDTLGTGEIGLMGNRSGARFGSAEESAMAQTMLVGFGVTAETLTVFSLWGAGVAGGMALPGADGDAPLNATVVVGGLLVSIAVGERAVRTGVAGSLGGFGMSIIWGMFLGVIASDALIADVVSCMVTSWVPLLHGAHAGLARLALNSVWVQRRALGTGVSGDANAGGEVWVWWCLSIYSIWVEALWCILGAVLIA